MPCDHVVPLHHFKHMHKAAKQYRPFLVYGRHWILARLRPQGTCDMSPKLSGLRFGGPVFQSAHRSSSFHRFRHELHHCCRRPVPRPSRVEVPLHAVGGTSTLATVILSRVLWRDTSVQSCAFKAARRRRSRTRQQKARLGPIL